MEKSPPDQFMLMFDQSDSFPFRLIQCSLGGSYFFCVGGLNMIYIWRMGYCISYF